MSPAHPVMIELSSENAWDHAPPRTLRTSHDGARNNRMRAKDTREANELEGVHWAYICQQKLSDSFQNKRLND